ncbi:MAG: hypothetical protein ACR5K7_01030 [Symbiopectobacterium sp.]
MKPAFYNIETSVTELIIMLVLLLVVLFCAGAWLLRVAYFVPGSPHSDPVSGFFGRKRTRAEAEKGLSILDVPLGYKARLENA